jgi:two-component system OmpR family sensor kinase
MNRKGSLQRRLALGLALGVTITWLAATIAAGLLVRHGLDEAFDSAIQETAQRILPLAVVDIVNREGPLATQRIPLVRPHQEYLTYVVRDGAGNILLRSHDADPAVFPSVAEPGFTETDTHRLYTEAAVQGTIAVTVAEPLTHRRQAALEVSLALAMPLLVLVPASIAAVWWWARVSLRPVHSFRDAIETRGHGDLKPIGTASLPAEIGPIADAVNRLMERLRRALESERSFAANSAHELRTPIAAALAQAQRLIAEASDPLLKDRARQIQNSLRSLARITEKLMQLAKAEGGGVLSETEHDLVPIVSLVVGELRRATDGSRLRLLLPKRPLLSELDADAFAILVRNLVENAVRHGAASEPVTISLSEQGELSVSNGGPAVPADILARLTQPFERGQTTSKGSGLGLAIADAIASGAGTRLELLSPIPGTDRGFEARIQLPSMLVRSLAAGKQAS